ncbi:morphogenic membrane protein MmpB [Streptomyces sp. URMC 126]
MLWSDPSDEPPDELREAQAMLRRAGVLLAVGMVVLFLLLGAV